MKFLETSLRHLVKASDYATTADRISAAQGWLQRIDPRVKIAALVALLIVAAASRQLTPIALVLLFACLLAVGSHIPLHKLARWVWLPVLLFTGIIASPAAFMSPGLRGAVFPVLRAEAAATLSALLVLTTPWPRILRALRWFRVPAVIVVILGMTIRYIFVILETALEMLESRKSRTVGIMPATEKRRLASASAGVLLSKSMALSNEVHLAMLSRGFRGDIRLLEDAR
jgi:cobalt ECF transporter T component CbiQ